MAYGLPEPGIRTELQLQPSLQLWQHWILNLLCWAGDLICVLVLQRHGQSHCAIAGTLVSVFLIDSCSVNSCNFDVSVRRGELMVFLLHCLSYIWTFEFLNKISLLHFQYIKCSLSGSPPLTMDLPDSLRLWKFETSVTGRGYQFAAAEHASNYQSRRGSDILFSFISGDDWVQFYWVQLYWVSIIRNRLWEPQWQCHVFCFFYPLLCVLCPLAT